MNFICRLIGFCLLLDRAYFSHAAGLRPAGLLSRPAVMFNMTDDTSDSGHSINTNNDTSHSLISEDYTFNLTDNLDGESVHNMLAESISKSRHSDSKFESYVQWAVGCGGTLIYEDIVLSAAHCYNPRGHVSDRVWVGSNKFRDGKQRKVEDFIPHPKYSAETYQYDFLILKLDSPVDATVTKMNSLNSVPSDGNSLTVVGFGNDPETDVDKRANTLLKEAELDFVPSEQCKQLYGGRNVNDEVNICAGHGEKEICEGDSGGPIFSSSGLQVGVASWNNGCDQAGFPGVYSRISYAFPWIQNQICMHSSNPPKNCVPISVNFLSDAHPSEIRWSIKGDNGLGEDDYEHTMYYSYLNVKPNGYMEKPLMLLPGRYRFEIVDSYGDGMEGGGYSIWTGKDLIERSGDFDAFDSVEFSVETGGTEYVVEEERFLQVNATSAPTESVIPSQMPSAMPSDEPDDEKYHKIEIEIKYDNKPNETSWTLFRKLATEIYTQPFNDTSIGNEFYHIIVEDLISGKYWFRILDDNYDGICCDDGEGMYKIIDRTDDKDEVIYESDGNFFWYELVEFELKF